MIEILQFRGAGPVAALIRWQGWGRYAHSATIVNNAYYEATALADPKLLLNGKSGIVRRFTSHREVDALRRLATDIFFVRSSPRQNEIYQKFLDSQLGKAYDIWSVLRFLPRNAESRKSSGKWFCSELVFAALRKAELYPLRRILPYQVDPNCLTTSPLLLSWADLAAGAHELTVDEITYLQIIQSILNTPPCNETELACAGE